MSEWIEFEDFNFHNMVAHLWIYHPDWGVEFCTNAKKHEIFSGLSYERPTHVMIATIPDPPL